MNETTTSGWTVLDTAHAALRTVVRGLSDQDLARPTPCSEWNVAQVVQHAAGDQLAFASSITGEPGPGFNPFEPSGTLDGSPADLLEPCLTACAAAWATVDRDATEVAVPVPPGSLKPGTGAGAAALDAAVHAWDIAVATARPSPLAPELAGPLLAVARQIVEPLRQYGAYAAALGHTGDISVHALLCYLGRDPGWTA
ncbi:TIGR03086 family protein [Actinomadura darangshiensis]|uniref:TIGR03086 family protein n=1 Tax=Actinomadura darangshiensis TaxID=705336 RepID=A0A4R5AZA2_9ACTN|nr:TIGR03086 family metal-binding protein [Actinomadura darangshiensis]TDD78035.1 TIGR03086 family protein [Actinomadura darangshiensis]